MSGVLIRWTLSGILICNGSLFYLERHLVVFHRSQHQDVSSFNGRFSALTSTNNRNEPVGLIRSHLEPVGLSARFSCTNSTGMPFMLAPWSPLWCSLILSLLCRVSREFSRQTMLGNRCILLPLENTTPSILCLGTTRFSLGTSVACVRELRQFDLHVVLWVL